MSARRISTDATAHATRVLLVRHGRTAVNAQGRLSGRHDPELDEVGHLQATELAAALASRAAEDVAAGRVTIVSSPLRRCVDTASEVAVACGLERSAVRTDARFVEMDYGEWDGRPLAEVPAEAWRQWRTDPTFCPPGGERLAAVTQRVAAGLSDWSIRVGDGTLVVASHVSPIKAGVIWALGVDEAATWRMRLDNASICALAVTCGPDGVAHPALVSFNEIAHLEDPD